MENEVEGTVEQSTEVPQEITSTEQPGLNQAWNDVISVIPPSFVPLVTPHLQEWDKNYQKVQEAHKPFESFVKEGVTPEDIQNALTVLRVLNDNPRAVYDRMTETFADEWGLNRQQPQQPVVGAPQGLESNEQELDFGDFAGLENSPQYQKLLQNQQAIAQFFVAQKEAEEAAAADAQLDQELNSLKSKHGDFDEQVVLSLAATGMPLEAAVQRYISIAGASRQQATNASFPRIMPTGGGIPSQAVDVASLSDKDTRGLALAFLNAHKG